MKSKVLLVKPPEQSDFNFGAFSLGVLAASVRDIADTSILDATELSIDDAARAVESNAPDWVGITIMGLKSINPAMDFIRHVRLLQRSQGKRNNAAIVVGGHGASMVPQLLLEAGASVAVIGEGELTFRNIVTKGILPGSPGCACLVNNQLVVGPRQDLIHALDQLEPPARDLMPNPRDGIHLMETSRGCPFACTFCETTRFYGKRWRPFSPDKVAQEVRRLVNEYDAWIVHFTDDNFTASPERALQICRLLSSGPLPAYFIASARADDLLCNPDLLPAMREARILRITVGVETLNPEMAIQVNKPIFLDTYKMAFARMKELGIFSIASFIVGLPGETEEMRRQILALAIEAGPDSARFIPFMPLPGTPLYRGEEKSDPDTEDIVLAEKLNRDFSLNPHVQERLKEDIGKRGVRGLLCRAALEKNV